jgi:hypothetical protein
MNSAEAESHGAIRFDFGSIRCSMNPRSGRTLKLKMGGLSLAALVALVALGTAPGARAADEAATASDRALIQSLVQRLDRQEKEIETLKSKLADRNPPAATGDGGQRPVASTGEMDQVKARVKVLEDVAAQEQKQGDTFPSLEFHGFADVNFIAGDSRPERDSFALGQLDLFLTSKLSTDLGVLSELVVEAGDNNEFGFEIERLLLQYHPNEYFNIDVGRYHTAVGYYNTAYHHGAWFQTATGRPFFLEFEDNGGIIPAHNVGISVHGAIPSGKWGLGYIFEVGNGRQYGRPGSEENEVLNVTDVNPYKAFNAVLIARPEFAPGLQLGVGAYYDVLTPDGLPRTNELILHGHVVYKTDVWEFLSEAYLIHHAERNGDNHLSPAAYAQLARRIGAWTPYVRFSYFGGATGDPIYQLIERTGTQYVATTGLRWDFATFVALKLQYDLMLDRGDLTNQVTLQLSFTF